MARNQVKSEKESDVTPTAAETLEFDDVTLKAIAEVYKNEGNDEYRKKEFNGAVDFYTQGIQVNCKDEELNAKLFSNRAAAQFYLGNYRDSLSDAKAAKTLQPSYMKPIERAASACEKLRMLQEAITWCDEGLAIDPKNKTLLQLRTRSVNEQDKLQKAAREKMGSESDTQTVEGKDGGSIKAIQQYTLLLRRARITKDRAEEGTAYFNLGEVYQSLSDFNRAMEHYKQCLDIAKELGDRATERTMCCRIGVSYKLLGCFKEALHYHHQHLAIAKDVGDRNGEGDAYGNLGNTYLSLGDIKQALQYYKKALSVTKEVRDRVKEGVTHVNIGCAYQLLGDFKQALEYHKQLLPIAKELGRKDWEGAAYGNIGIALKSLGYLKEALDYQKQCLGIAKSSGNKPCEGKAYGSIGCTYRSLGDLKQAVEFHKQSLAIAKDIGDRAGEGSSYGSLGTTYQTLGYFKEALDCSKQQLSIAIEIGDRLGEGNAYGNIGNIHQSLGDFKTALNYQKRKLQIAEEVGATAAQGTAYGSIGLAYDALGDYKQAVHYHQQQLFIAKQAGDRLGEGNAYGNIGNTYQSLGDFKQAILYHKKHVSVAKNIGDRAGVGRSFGSLGTCYRNLDDLEQAIIYHKQRLDIAIEVGDKAGEGAAYANIGNAYLNLGDVEKALNYHQKDLDLVKKLGSRAAEGEACGNLGKDYQSLCDFEKAINYHKQELTIAKEVEDRAGEGRAYYSLGLSFEALGFCSEAFDCYQASVTRFNSIRRLLQSKDEWKISLRNQHQRTYTALWRILLKQNKINEALVAAEEGRAQALADLMESQYGFRPEQSGLGEQEETYDILGRFPSNTVFLGVDRNEINTWVLVDGQDAQLRKKSVGANVMKRGAPSSFETLMENAYENIGVRAGVKCENRSLDALKDEDCNSVPDNKSDVKDSRLGNDQDNPLRTLYDFIIDPAANLFQGDELIIVPDGPLFLAPFAALQDSGSRYLCESFRIRLLPSLTILRFITDSPADYHCRSGALLVGDPKVEGIGLPALPCARREVEMIGRILKTSPLIGAEATKAEVLKRLNTVALVHIAAHGCKETGEIALAPNRRRQSGVPKKEDFLLTMADVLGVKLRPRLVVLSCCHSGRGEIKAEGVVGIARAFLGAGARAVLVTLWAIDDEATLEFMTSFYQHLVEERSAGEALSQAMKHMRESTEYRDVKYWAPFTLIGDDVKLEFGENKD